MKSQYNEDFEDNGGSNLSPISTASYANYVVDDYRRSPDKHYPV